MWDLYVISIPNSVRIGQSVVIGNILALEVAPRLRIIDLGPGVHEPILQDLLGGNPVVSTRTETLALVEVFLSS